MKNYFFISLLWFLFPFIVKGQSVINGGFEEGSGAGWIIYSSNGAGLIGTAAFFYSTSIEPAVYPRSGQYMARLGGFGYAVNSLSQNITLPSTPKVYLHLYYQDRNSTTSECAGLWVGARIQVIIAGQTLTDTYLCYANQVNDWVHAYYDLSTAAGMTINVTVRAEAANSVWSYIYLDDISISSSLTDVEDDGIEPDNFTLEQNYPNPFNPVTTIKYSIPNNPLSPAPCPVSLKVYDLLGNEVATLVNELQPVGNYEVMFDGINMSCGVYFYKLQTYGFTAIKKLLLVK